MCLCFTMFRFLRCFIARTWRANHFYVNYNFLFMLTLKHIYCYMLLILFEKTPFFNTNIILFKLNMPVRCMLAHINNTIIIIIPIKYTFVHIYIIIVLFHSILYVINHCKIVIVIAFSSYIMSKLNILKIIINSM